MTWPGHCPYHTLPCHNWPYLDSLYVCISLSDCTIPELAVTYFTIIYLNYPLPYLLVFSSHRSLQIVSIYKLLHWLRQHCWWADCRCSCVVHTASHYAALCIPNSAGAVKDLARNVELRTIVNSFLAEKSKICCQGASVTMATEPHDSGRTWELLYCLTSNLIWSNIIWSEMIWSNLAYLIWNLVYLIWNLVYLVWDLVYLFLDIVYLFVNLVFLFLDLFYIF